MTISINHHEHAKPYKSQGDRSKNVLFQILSTSSATLRESLDGFVYLLGSELHRLRQTFSKLIALQLFAELLGHNAVDIL